MLRVRNSRASWICGKGAQKSMRYLGYTADGVVAVNDIGRAVNSGNKTQVAKASSSAAGGVAGGWAGAEAGIAYGAILGGPVGAFVGGVVGGVAGGWAGSSAAEMAVDGITKGNEKICDECLGDDANKMLW